MVLGRGDTISKAITVVEILKREINGVFTNNQAEEAKQENVLEQKTEIYKQKFGENKAPESCIKMVLKIGQNQIESQELSSKLRQLFDTE